LERPSAFLAVGRTQGQLLDAFGLRGIPQAKKTPDWAGSNVVKGSNPSFIVKPQSRGLPIAAFRRRHLNQSLFPPGTAVLWRLSAKVMYIPAMKKIRVNVYLLARQLKRLEAESERTGSSVAELVRKAIDAVYPVKAGKS